MAPNNKFEFAILNLSFGGYLEPGKPNITLSYEKDLPTSPGFYVQEWFVEVMANEMEKLPRSADVCFTECDVESPNSELFIFHNKHFLTNAMLIMGAETTHYLFYKNKPRSRRYEGSGELSLKYCGCCLDKQYEDIVKEVRDVLVYKCR